MFVLDKAGFGVWIPLGHSPDIDLIAQKGEELLRVQVKTATFQRAGRFEVKLATCHQILLGGPKYSEFEVEESAILPH